MSSRRRRPTPSRATRPYSGIGEPGRGLTDATAKPVAANHKGEVR